MEPIEILKKQLNESNIEFETDVSLAKYTSYRTGGPAALFIKPNDPQITQTVQKLVKQNSVPAFYLGGGSNVLFDDKGFNGVVIYSDYEDSLEIVDIEGKSLVEVNANHSSTSFSRKIGDMGYSGFEFLSTIPGRLAGAVVQNAGCYGSEIKDILESVLISSDQKMGWIPTGELEFSYRSSLFKKEPAFYIHALRFFLTPGNKKTIQQKMDEFKEKRKNSQPKNRKSAGSVFKNPPQQKAWQLISECGLSGYKEGGACLSTEHANFIVNQTNATSTDIQKIIHHVQKTVLQQTGIELQPEVILVPIA